MAQMAYTKHSFPVTVGSFIKRKAHLTEAEFYTHWYTKHGVLVAPWAKRHGLIAYRQFHTPTAVRKEWTAATGIACVECDGYAEATFSSVEEYLKAAQDPYWQTVINPDHDNFWDAEASTSLPQGICSMAGIVRDIVKDGEIVPEIEKLMCADSTEVI